MVDKGEGGYGVVVLAVLRWFVEETERDGDEEDEDGCEEGGSGFWFPKNRERREKMRVKGGGIKVACHARELIYVYVCIELGSTANLLLLCK